MAEIEQTESIEVAEEEEGNMRDRLSSRFSEKMETIRGRYAGSQLNALRQLKGHRLALWLERITSWYRPVRPGEDQPSLADGWSYFEHITLPRRLIDGSEDVIRATPGANEDSVLYSIWGTREVDLGEFGIGMSSYFASLRIMCIVFFFAGLLYIPTMYFYSHDTYQKVASSLTEEHFLYGSAVCPTTEWVPCVDCDLIGSYAEERIVNATLGDETIEFVLRNTCDTNNFLVGINHIVVFLFVYLAVSLVSRYQSGLDLTYDEHDLTASDFSIKVWNPPKEATDPEDWMKFFSQFGNVVYVTVAVNNDKLVQALSYRRTLVSAFVNWMPNDFHMDEHDDEDFENIFAHRAKESDPTPGWKKPFQLFGLLLDPPALYTRFERTSRLCSDLIHVDYDTSAVYVTFETERAQRNALEALSVGTINVYWNNTESLENSDHLFNGNVVLGVHEAKEPSAIRWENLDEGIIQKFWQRFIALAITLGIIALDIILINYVMDFDVGLGAIVVSILNSTIPYVLKFLQYMIEAHPDEGSFQAYLYFKIILFRIINTVLATALAYGYTNTLSTHSFLEGITAIFYAETFTTPFLQLIDISGQFKRHFLAPRALNQDSLLAQFRGTPFFIADKYTSLTKVMMMGMVYSVIYPGAYFYSSLSLFIQYFVDRFSLLRTWARQGKVGNEIALLSRNYFYPLVVIGYAYAIGWWWGNFPHDNLCDINDDIDASQYFGDWTFLIPSTKDNEETFVKVSVGDETLFYKSCGYERINFMSPLERGFQIRDKPDNAKTLQQVYTIGLFVVCASLIVYNAFQLRDIICSFIKNTYDPDKEYDSTEAYTDQKVIQAYIPMVQNYTYEHPLLACDICEINHKHIGWVDPFKSYQHYSIFHDVNMIKKKEEESVGERLFSVVKYFPPEGRGS